MKILSFRVDVRQQRFPGTDLLSELMFTVETTDGHRVMTRQLLSDIPDDKSLIDHVFDGAKQHLLQELRKREATK